MDVYSIRKSDLLFASIGLLFLLSLKFGTGLIDSAFVLLLFFASLKAVVELALRFRRNRISYVAAIKPLIVTANALCASLYALMYCDVKLRYLPSFGDDQSTFLNVIGRVGESVDNAQFSEGGIGLYAYFSFVKTVSAPFVPSNVNQAIHSLHFSWMFGLLLLFIAGSIATVSLIDFNRKSLMYIVISLVFVDVILLSAFHQIFHKGYFSLLIALICLILGLSFISESNGFVGVGFRNPLLYLWFALLAWWPLYVFLVVLIPGIVIELIRKKNMKISVLQVLSTLLGLLVIAINLYYSILQGKSLQFLSLTADQDGTFILDIPVIEIALLISITVIYFSVRQNRWRAHTTFFALYTIFLLIFKFDGYSTNYGMSKIAMAVSVSSAVVGIPWLLSVVQQFNQHIPMFIRGLIYLLFLAIPISHASGNFRLHAETLGLLDSNVNSESGRRLWFDYLANTNAENAPQLCVFFELSEPFNNEMESYMCSKWGSAQNGNLNPTSMDWGQAILNGDRSINRLRSLKIYIEENNILVVTDNVSLANIAIDPLVVVARDAAELVEIR